MREDKEASLREDVVVHAKLTIRVSTVHQTIGNQNQTTRQPDDQNVGRESDNQNERSRRSEERGHVVRRCGEPKCHSEHLVSR